MYWLLVFVIAVAPGKQVEMVVTYKGEPKKYSSEKSCNDDAPLLLLIGMNRPRAIFCRLEHPA